MTLQIASATGAANVDLASAVMTYTLTLSADTPPQDVDVQAYVHNTTTGKWAAVVSNPAQPTSLFPGRVDTLTLQAFLPLGVYDQARLLLFQSGTNFNTFVGQTFVTFAPFTVATLQRRVSAPTLTVEHPLLAADGSVSQNYTVKLPSGYNDGGGLWSQSQGTYGFGQQWISNAALKANTDPLDSYLRYDGTFVLKPTDQFPPPTKPGIYGNQFNLFKASWGTAIANVWPGTLLAIGGDAAIVHCDPAKRPLFRDCMKPVGVQRFALGGNGGNAWASGASINPAGYHDPDLIALIDYATGSKILRYNLDADRYLDPADPYRLLVRACAEANWMVGNCVIFGAQRMPTGGEDALVTFDTILVTDFKDALDSVGFDDINEPIDYLTWEQWRPLALRTCQAMKAVDPRAIVICAGPGLSKDLSGIPANPLPVGVCDYYAIHAYIDAASLPAAIPANLSNVLIEEYQTTDLAWHIAVQSLPNVVGVFVWDWDTYQVDDSIGLIKGRSGATLTLTDKGNTIAGYNKTWIAGGTLTLPPPPPPVVPPPPLTPDQVAAVNALIAAAIKPLALVADVNLVRGQEVKLDQRQQADHAVLQALQAAKP